MRDVPAGYRGPSRDLAAGGSILYVSKSMLRPAPRRPPRPRPSIRSPPRLRLLENKGLPYSSAPSPELAEGNVVPEKGFDHLSTRGSVSSVSSTAPDVWLVLKESADGEKEGTAPVLLKIPQEQTPVSDGVPLYVAVESHLLQALVGQGLQGNPGSPAWACHLPSGSLSFPTCMMMVVWAAWKHH